MTGGSFDHNLVGIADGQTVKWDDTGIVLVPAWFAELCADPSTFTDGDLIEWDSASGCFVATTGGGGGSAGPGGAGPWIQNDVAASQTDVALTLLDGTRETIPAPCAGTITCVAVLCNEARTAGTLTVEITVNGTGTGLTAVLDDTNTTCHSTVGEVAVAACDEIGVDVTTDGSWAPTASDITVGVQFGSGVGAGTFSGVSVFRDTFFALPSSAVFAAIPFDNENFDTDAYHDNVTNNTRLTVPVDGKYLLTCSVEVRDSSQNPIVGYWINGVSVNVSERGFGRSESEFETASGAVLLDLLGGDYVEVVAFAVGGTRRVRAGATAQLQKVSGAVA